MARRFAYVSFGMLCLVAAYQLGARDARADWDNDGPGFIIGAASGIGGGRVWTADGKSYRLLGSAGFERDVEWADLPIPTTNVKLLADDILVSNDDDVWQGASSAGWEYVGRLGGPVSLAEGSWGETKAQFR
ncbi:MAG: hypothetical protein DHS20C21_01740 [Gemmatimonadota bacterium]|nr:MAG: hypothetical protein DHS20C21_01740 [Gemmatimonadota bacterium]